jgi:hypothetical protein
MRRGVPPGIGVQTLLGLGSRRQRCDSARIPAAFGFDRFLRRAGRGVRAGQRRRGRGLADLAHLRGGLGLQRLQQPQRPPELGQRGAAIAQERVERPGAVAVADQGEAEIPIAVGMQREQLGLDALGAL